jgi:hypothetical protein
MSVFRTNIDKKEQHQCHFGSEVAIMTLTRMCMVFGFSL